MSNPNKNAVDLINLIKDKFAMRKDIAPVETSSTASRAYKVGDKFYYGNLLQKATQDIAQGTGLAGGVNFENADPVTEQVTSLKETLTNQINNNGAKNLCPISLKDIREGNNSGTWSDNSYTYRGVTWTLNLNDLDEIESVGVNGTATGGPSQIYISSRDIAEARDNYNFIKTIENLVMSISSTETNVKINVSVYNGYTWVRQQQTTTNANVTLDLTGGDIIYVTLVIENHQSASNVVVYPMICLASDYALDPTYTPPAMTNRKLTTDKVGMDLLSEVGAVNLFNNTAVTQQNNGITFTVNEDKSVTVSGSVSTSPAQIDLGHLLSGLVKGKTYRLTGLPEDVSTCYIKFYLREDYSVVKEISGNIREYIFTYDGNSTYDIQIGMRTVGTSGGNRVFKPMISPVEYTGPYVPYAKSNKELTELTDNYEQDAVKFNYGIFTVWAKPSFATSTNLTTETILSIFSAMPYTSPRGSSIKIGTYEANLTLFNDIKTWFNLSNVRAGVLEIIKLEPERGLVRFTEFDTADIYEGWIISSAKSNRYKFTGTALS